MKRWLKIIVLTLLPVAGVVICALRWQAWFGMPAEKQWTGEVQEYVFPTFASDSLPGFEVTDEGWQDTLSPQALDILILGDIHNNLTRADYDSLAAWVPQADAVAQVGDWMHRGQEYYRQWLLREWVPSGLCALPVINTPGNHEYSKGIHKTLSPVWSHTFPQPSNGPVGVPGKHYYVDFPQLRFIVLDTNPLTRLVYLTRTLTWLRKTMATAGDRYIVVMMHHPVFSAAKGRFNSLIYLAFRHALGEADLVIAGHDHSYMRRSPFMVLNTSGTPKPQRFHYRTDHTDTVPTFAVLSIQRTTVAYQPSPMHIHVHRMDNGEVIDFMYVKHD